MNQEEIAVPILSRFGVDLKDFIILRVYSIAKRIGRQASGLIDDETLNDSYHLFILTGFDLKNEYVASYMIW